MPGLPVRVYECHVTGVREDDRVIDALSRNGTTFQRVSYLLPWISAVGSGIDVIPKTGDQCLIMSTNPNPRHGDGGRMTFVIGFKVPTNPSYEGAELGERYQGLPQGSVVIRARGEDGEAHLILNATGSLVLGANDTCRTLYSPVDSSVVTLFDSWKLTGPGGFVRWTRDPGSNAVAYHASYATRTELASGDAEESRPGDMVVDVKIGGEQDDPLDISVVSSLEEDPLFRVRIDRNGETWIEGEVLNFVGKSAITIDAPDLVIKKRKVLAQKDPI